LSLVELKTRFRVPDKAVLLDVKSNWSLREARELGYCYWRL
jgi:hypothetical protein